ncbi:hypothetical protein N9J85_00770 [bacterium]|nr:hypothetical protein [bacterium]
MIAVKKIIRLERKIVKLELKINRLKKREASPTTLNTYRSKISELNNEINRLCCINLEISNSNFAKIAKESYNYLAIDHLAFKTYQEEMSYSGSYAKTLHGKLNSNGHIYCNAITTNNWLFSPFAKYFFPSEFTGTINCIGNVRVKATKIEPAFINRLPSELSARITSKGTIKLTTTKTEGDFFTQGKILISKIIGQYTFKDSERASCFF